MSQIHAHLAPEEPKKHGDPMAMNSGPSTSSTTDSSMSSKVDSRMKLSMPSQSGFYQAPRSSPVPPAESGHHAYSAAAHLGPGAQPHTKPAASSQGFNPAALREPPSFIERAGKQHR